MSFRRRQLLFIGPRFHSVLLPTGDCAGRRVSTGGAVRKRKSDLSVRRRECIVSVSRVLRQRIGPRATNASALLWLAMLRLSQCYRRNTVRRDKYRYERRRLTIRLRNAGVMERVLYRQRPLLDVCAVFTRRLVRLMEGL